MIILERINVVREIDESDSKSLEKYRTMGYVESKEKKGKKKDGNKSTREDKK